MHHVVVSKSVNQPTDMLNCILPCGTACSHCVYNESDKAIVVAAAAAYPYAAILPTLQRYTGSSPTRL